MANEMKKERTPFLERYGKGERSFEGTAFSDEKIAGVTFENVRFVNCVFTNVDFSNSLVQSVEWRQCELIGCRLTGTICTQTAFVDSVLRDCEAFGGQFRGDGFVNVRMERCDLSGSEIGTIRLGEGGGMERVSLEFCRLEEVSVAGARVDYSSFKGTQIVAGCFESATMKECNFDGCLLTGGRFFRCSLQSATFCDAKLSGGCFEDSDLSWVAFDKANLRNATVLSSVIDQASFQDANLTGLTLGDTVNLLDAQWERFRYRTKLVKRREVVAGVTVTPLVVGRTMSIRIGIPAFKPVVHDALLEFMGVLNNYGIISEVIHPSSGPSELRLHIADVNVPYSVLRLCRVATLLAGHNEAFSSPSWLRSELAGGRVEALLATEDDAEERPRTGIIEATVGF